MHLIGIHGKKRSGKDTVAMMIAETLPPMEQFKVHYFAKKVKDICAVTFDVGRPIFDMDIKDAIVPHLGISPRYMMTSLSDAIKSAYGQDFFAKIVLDEIDTYKHGLHIVVDVRYPYEAEAIRKRGGTILHVYREQKVEENPHESEQGIPIHNLDTVLFNHSTLEDLRAQVALFMQEHELSQAA